MSTPPITDVYTYTYGDIKGNNQIVDILDVTSLINIVANGLWESQNNLLKILAKSKSKPDRLSEAADSADIVDITNVIAKIANYTGNELTQQLGTFTYLQQINNRYVRVEYNIILQNVSVFSGTSEGVFYMRDVNIDTVSDKITGVDIESINDSKLVRFSGEENNSEVRLFSFTSFDFEDIVISTPGFISFNRENTYLGRLKVVIDEFYKTIKIFYLPTSQNDTAVSFNLNNLDFSKFTSSLAVENPFQYSFVLDDSSELELQTLTLNDSSDEVTLTSIEFDQLVSDLEWTIGSQIVQFVDNFSVNNFQASRATVPVISSALVGTDSTIFQDGDVLYAAHPQVTSDTLVPISFQLSNIDYILVSKDNIGSTENSEKYVLLQLFGFQKMANDNDGSRISLSELKFILKRQGKYYEMRVNSDITTGLTQQIKTNGIESDWNLLNNEIELSQEYFLNLLIKDERYEIE